MSRYQRIHFKNQTTRYFRKKCKQNVRLIWLVVGWLIERDAAPLEWLAGWLHEHWLFLSCSRRKLKEFSFTSCHRINQP